MAGCAIDSWIPMLETVDVCQQVTVDRAHHFPHVARNLLCWLVISVPFTWNVTMGATHPERVGETYLHDSQEVHSGYSVKDFDVLEDSFCWLGFLASDLLGEFRNFVIVELLDRLWSGRFKKRAKSVSLLAVPDSNQEQNSLPRGL